MNRYLTLGEALRTIIDHRGKTPKKLGGDWSLSGHRVVSALNIKNNRVDDNDHHYVDDVLYAKWMKTPLRRGDVILTSEAPLGEVAYLDRDVDWCLGQRVFGLRGDPSVLDGRYLSYLLRGGPVRDQLLARSTGSTVAGIRQSELVKVELDLPPVDVQQRIAATLGALDDKIESDRRAHSLIWDLLAAEYDRLTVAATEAELRALLMLEYGKSLPATSRVAGSVPVYGSSGVTGTHNAALIDGPNVIVGRKGSIGEVHWSHVASFPIDTTYYVVPTNGYPLLACYFALRNAKLQDKNSDSAVPGLNREAALSTRVVAPSLEMARSWAASCMPLLSELRHLEAEVELLGQLRDRLLPELLSGRIRAPEATEIVEEAVA
jgi:type I restriction enzyme S subunit